MLRNILFLLHCTFFVTEHHTLDTDDLTARVRNSAFSGGQLETLWDAQYIMFTVYNSEFNMAIGVMSSCDA